ncbi:MAG TPA: polyprenyl synthetase family protein [Thermoanaerobaculia bacterium]|jgi:geranylgeranyl diphosphate synthase type I|nr:polyprenyl synthetase family protein [Thermoanaerobaculia bacterium]
MEFAVHLPIISQRFERLKERVLHLPEVNRWSEMRDLVGRAKHRDEISVWEYPVAACLASGGTEEQALPGAAAIFCALTAIHLIDDLLDNDPQGDFHHLGVGRAANLASAFQAAAHRLIENTPTTADRASALQTQLSRAFFATARGQDLDTVEAVTEEDYWRRVEAKTPPLFAAAFAIGGLLAGASDQAISGFERLGGSLGRFIQVSDDLADALGAPAGADWNRPRNNLALHYALSAAYPERDEFARLSEVAEEPEALAAAQKILFKSGAVSYCALQMSHFSTESRRQVQQIAVASRDPLDRLVDRMVRPLEHLFSIGAGDEPREIPEQG